MDNKSTQRIINRYLIIEALVIVAMVFTITIMVFQTSL